MDITKIFWIHCCLFFQWIRIPRLICGCYRLAYLQNKLQSDAVLALIDQTFLQLIFFCCLNLLKYMFQLLFFIKVIQLSGKTIPFSSKIYPRCLRTRFPIRRRDTVKMWFIHTKHILCNNKIKFHFYMAPLKEMVSILRSWSSVYTSNQKLKKEKAFFLYKLTGDIVHDR